MNEIQEATTLPGTQAHSKECSHRHRPCTCGYEAELERKVAVLTEALETICDLDARPYRCLNIARSALESAEKQPTELDEMVACAIESAIETSPEFNHGWRTMPDKELIPEILDEIPDEYTETDIAEAIYRYKLRRLTGDSTR
jgi:hypothetical protein